MKKTIMIKVDNGSDLEQLGFKKDLTGKFCPMPFESLTVDDEGRCWLCCSSNLPYVIGNLYENTFEEIWQSDIANEIRSSILDFSFKYCNHSVCCDISDDQLEDSNGPVSAKPYPTHIFFNTDKSCNLSCPSCRTEKIYDFEGEAYEKKKEMFYKIINYLFATPHDQEIVLDITGSGDPFGSKIYRDFLTTFDPTPWPNLILDIQTNGVMLTPTNWKRISKWHNKIRALRISIDAGTESTYNVTRRGGNWNVLLDNLEHINEKINTYKNVYVIIRYVVQDLNYKEMGNLVQLIVNNFDNFYSIDFQLVFDWGTWDYETYMQRAIWREAHPMHQDFLESIKDPILTHDKVRLGNIKNFLK
jgi:MoaA/NifB/PqqE/SkfB family radical SAM enzyme